MVLKANDRRTSCPCHDEFRGPRSDYVRQIDNVLQHSEDYDGGQVMRCIELLTTTLHSGLDARRDSRSGVNPSMPKRQTVLKRKLFLPRKNAADGLSCHVRRNVLHVKTPLARSKKTNHLPIASFSTAFTEAKEDTLSLKLHLLLSFAKQRQLP
ncbi:hypothetical protein TNCV_4562481 [Trichonephila clavipes]|nr:hypothetical protein TNCV_4562481 [Trichonephila clavipes]